MKLLLLPLLASFALSTVAQADESVVHLVLSFSRGTIKTYRPMSQAAVAIPMASMDKCQEEGEIITNKNTEEVRTVFWCVDGGVKAK